ncbi:hypothetical protein A2716_01820 [candidate division WWE3 bacterium RIFCSPHIGHO2_01_FULL_40_23]|uniref:Homing endonuclease LAGLIDADG domain-containing protein n=1 Tax=candidate division WWE3 bacterium RIFCSPLOWO2_01_FULL_41_18 TaxID=1802625 RepID=A0A1F4VEW1_UNCKA|nr:MAG: hypothetical protein A2716_01820 [candidate division WWE3 bacterium RIFCSPHIGHO2_01_FULL_40_23]OGC55727.1 MAG: hypothetical protein A3A78_01670 [candidate division WWE3 bacterium RIFCSPLOWO2_01_FULL_41_18]
MLQLPLSEECIQVILGSILGDGSLTVNRGYANARLSFRHSVTQQEYFYWKVEKLKEISSDKCVFRQGSIYKKDGFGEIKLRFQSLALESLTYLHKFTSKRSKKVIKRRWLNLLNPLGLLVWWLDDGSLVSNSREGVFCTDSFSKKEVDILIKYLKIVWGINTKIGSMRKGKSTYLRIYINSTEELKKFLRLILPHMKVEQMLPKFLILYKIPELQERWISEVVNLTTFKREVIEKYLSEKKSRYKRFRG